MVENIRHWMESFTRLLTGAFKERLLFLGLQGSYARGEATPQSDIDVVVLLDSMRPEDFLTYRDLCHNLPHRELLCGFVGGMDILSQWDKGELFWFCHDTVPYLGSLDAIASTITHEDIRRALHQGGCGIYHSAAHNLLHEKDPQMLRALLKSSVFLLRAKQFLSCGHYCGSQGELAALLLGDDAKLLAEAVSAKENPGQTLDLTEVSSLLLDWAGTLIRDYA